MPDMFVHLQNAFFTQIHVPWSWGTKSAEDEMQDTLIYYFKISWNIG